MIRLEAAKNIPVGAFSALLGTSAALYMLVFHEYKRVRSARPSLDPI